MTLEEIRSLIRDVPNFPKPGSCSRTSRRCSPIRLRFAPTTEVLADRVAPLRADGILAIESRGFIFGAALATRAGLPLQLVRKRGKLPRESFSVEYELEYGVDHLEMHKDAVRARRALLDRRRRDRHGRHRGCGRKSSRQQRGGDRSVRVPRSSSRS